MSPGETRASRITSVMAARGIPLASFIRQSRSSAIAASIRPSRRIAADDGLLSISPRTTTALPSDRGSRRRRPAIGPRDTVGLAPGGMQMDDDLADQAERDSLDAEDDQKNTEQKHRSIRRGLAAEALDQDDAKHDGTSDGNRRSDQPEESKWLRSAERRVGKEGG